VKQEEEGEVKQEESEGENEPLDSDIDDNMETEEIFAIIR